MTRASRLFMSTSTPWSICANNAPVSIAGGSPGAERFSPNLLRFSPPRGALRCVAFTTSENSRARFLMCSACRCWMRRMACGRSPAVFTSAAIGEPLDDRLRVRRPMPHLEHQPVASADAHAALRVEGGRVAVERLHVRATGEAHAGSGLLGHGLQDAAHRVAFDGVVP